MSDNVVKFYPLDAAKNPDNVLEQSIGEFKNVLVIGYDGEGMMNVRASTNFKVGEIILCIETFKHNLLSGEYDTEVMDDEE